MRILTYDPSNKNSFLPKNGRIVSLTQTHYIEKVLKKKFEQFDCALTFIPTDPVVKLISNNGSPLFQLEYVRLIGCLMYAMTSTQPDIAYAIGRLSRYTSNPIMIH